jgi:hypothetical protein
MISTRSQVRWCKLPLCGVQIAFAARNLRIGSEITFWASQSRTDIREDPLSPHSLNSDLPNEKPKRGFGHGSGARSLSRTPDEHQESRTSDLTVHEDDRRHSPLMAAIENKPEKHRVTNDDGSRCRSKQLRSWEPVRAGRESRRRTSSNCRIHT